jgi:peptidyl-prolyl cis-trans isomerase A (cyclophilin A)
MKKSLLVLCAAALWAGCSSKPAESPAAPPEAPAAVQTPLPPVPPPSNPALLAPEKAVETAPAVFKAKFTTTKGDFVVEVQRAWAPHGADRFYNLVKIGYFDDATFFRAVNGFMVQFGVNGSPDVNAKWRTANIPDDPSAGQSNKRGTIAFATAGPNTRTTQVFINYGDNGPSLDSTGFTPFGKVVSGMETLDALYQGYGDGPPYGSGPNQGRVQMEGNEYLRKEFPRLDFIKTAKLAD